MADYSVQSTQLSGYSGAGSQPVQPVEEKVADFGLPAGVGAIAEIFTKGVKAYEQEEAQKTKDGIVGAFTKEQAAVNDAVASGQMSPSEGAARQRASGNKFLASYPAYAKDFKKANDALLGITEKGEIAKQLETQQKRQDQLVSQAQTQGYIIPPDADQATTNTILNASQTAIRVKQAWEDQLKQNAEARAQGTFNQQVADRQQKEQSISLITDLASTNISSFAALGTSLAGSAKSGKIGYDEAKAQNAAQYAQIQGVLVAAGAHNPELAAAYRPILADLNRVNESFLDPKADVEALEAEKKRLITKAQIMGLRGDNDFLAAVATSNLIGNNQVPLQISNAAVKGLVSISSGLNSPSTPSVVGNANVESDVYRGLTAGIQDINSGKTKNKDKAIQEASMAVNNTLKQTDNLARTGQASASALKEVAKFYAGPEFASMVKNGTVDSQARQGAKRAFQMEYEPTVVKAINNRLDQVAPGATDTKLSSAVDIQFNGTGVIFSPKGPQTGRLGIPTTDMRNDAMITQTLKQSQDALNQLIHIGAHMEGTTDYQKYWEENKHFFLPKIYPDPAMLKPGQIKNGYRYDGGPPGDKSSWSKAG